MADTDRGSPEPAPGTGESTLERAIKDLKGRLVREATFAIGMLESASEALLNIDAEAARGVVRRDDDIDREEVIIEEECFRVLALHHPFARDFRRVVSLMRINADLERVGDHSTSIAKVTIKLSVLEHVPPVPTSLGELARRVPILCHGLLTALMTESPEGARSTLTKDHDIDTLEKRLFEECVQTMGTDRDARAAGLFYYRCGRELERIGDLMTNIAEDVLYLSTGHIVRHSEKKRLKALVRADKARLPAPPTP